MIKRKLTLALSIITMIGMTFNQLPALSIVKDAVKHEVEPSPSPAPGPDNNNPPASTPLASISFFNNMSVAITITFNDSTSPLNLESNFGKSFTPASTTTSCTVTSSQTGYTAGTISLTPGSSYNLNAVCSAYTIVAN